MFGIEGILNIVVTSPKPKLPSTKHTFKGFPFALFVAKAIAKSDAISVLLGVGLDIYDSVQRGVSPGGVALGATLTVAKGVGLIYLNKVILHGATALGSSACLGLGTVVGFVVGGVACIIVDVVVSNLGDDLIDKIAK